MHKNGSAISGGQESGGGARNAPMTLDRGAVKSSGGATPAPKPAPKPATPVSPPRDRG